MPLIRHRIDTVYPSPSAAAMRAAVIAPVIGGLGGRKLVAPGILQVAAYWRARVRDLAESPAAPDWLRKPSSLFGMLNCPPCGVRLREKTRVCGRPMLCPFCYGRRRVGVAYKAAKRAVKAAGGYPITVLAMTHDESFVGDTDEAATAARRRLLTAPLVGRRLRHSDRQPGMVGGFLAAVPTIVLDSVELRRIVMIVPGKYARVSRATLPCQFVELENNRDLADTIGAMFRLPYHFLRGNNDAALVLVDAFRRARLITTFGSSKTKEPEDTDGHKE